MASLDQHFVNGDWKKIKEALKKTPTLDKYCRMKISLVKDGSFSIFHVILLNHGIKYSVQEYGYIGAVFVQNGKHLNLDQMLKLELFELNKIFHGTWTPVHSTIKLFEKLNGNILIATINSLSRNGADFSLPVGEREETIMDTLLDICETNPAKHIFFQNYLKPIIGEPTIAKALKTHSTAGPAKDEIKRIRQQIIMLRQNEHQRPIKQNDERQRSTKQNDEHRRPSINPFFRNWGMINPSSKHMTS
jgi:hypothetical protein